MLTRPYIECSSSDLVDDGHGKAEPCKIHTFNVVFAGVTRFNPDVIVFRCVEVSEHRRSFF